VALSTTPEGMARSETDIASESSPIVRTGSRTQSSSAARETLTERVADGIAVAACVFFAAVAMWEMAGPPPGGHFGSSASFIIGGENMLRWHLFAVAPHYSVVRPTPETFYCHHPYGSIFLAALSSAVFGHHWFSIRMPAILCSALSAPLMYALGRSMWGILPAAIATITFVFLPIDLAFSSFTNLEVPMIFFGLLFSWGTVRLWQTWRMRWVVVATIGAFGAAQCDWVGLVLSGIVVMFAFTRAYILPRRWYGRINERLYAQWFGYVTAAAVGTFILYLVLFAKVDRLGDLLGSYHVRTSGSEAKLTDVFTQRRKMWLDWMLTRVGIGAIFGGLPLACLRLLRRPQEIIPVAWTLTAAFQYFVFKEGADVHIFWPHYFGPAVALSMGVITATLLWGKDRIARALPRLRLANLTASVMIGIILIACLAVLARTALPQLKQSRMTGGRFDDGGRHIDTDADAAQFTQWASYDVPADGVLEVVPGMPFTYAAEYGGRRAAHGHSGPLTSTTPSEAGRIAVADTRAIAPADLKTVAKQFAIQAVGPFWRIDRARTGPNLTAIRYLERQPGPLEWMFVVGTDLFRTIGPDPDEFAGWEWNDALDLDPVSPSPAPGTFEEIRIAHNVAIAHGDEAKAAALRERLMAKVKRPLRVDFSDDVHLLEVDVDSGPATVVTFLWETGPSYKPADTYFDVKCKVTEPPRFWPSKIDYFEKDMNGPPAIRPAMWKPRYLYTHRFVAMHRVGTEECRGAFAGTAAPRPPGNLADLPVFVLR
jgi:hypothetical protein